MYIAIRIAVMSAIAICYQLARGQRTIEETFAMAVVAVAAGHAAVYAIRGLRTRVALQYIAALVSVIAVLVAGGVWVAQSSRSLGPERYVPVGEMLAKYRDREVKLHGYVELGTRAHSAPRTFWIAEKGARVHVRLADGVVLPDTFAERAEVLMHGEMEGSDFVATDVMAKCPDTYQTADGPVPAARFRK